MKKIYLVGDPAEDWLILSEKYSRASNNPEPLRNWQKNDNTQLQKIKGGINLIYELLQNSGNNYEINLSPNIPSGKSVSGNFLQSISKLKTNVYSPGHYHVDEFLGYSSSKSEPFTNFTSVDLKRFDLVLIDDLTLDQSIHADHLLHNLSTFNPEGLILYKANVPLNENNLFECIADNYGHQLVTIIHADHLRESGLNLSKKLSWDATLDDLFVHLSSLPYYNTLSKSKIIIIRFGLEAALVIGQLDSRSEASASLRESTYKFFYIPEKCEDEIKENSGGLMQGITSAFVVAFINTYLTEKKENLNSDAICINPIINSMHAAIKFMKMGYCKNADGELIYPIKELVDLEPSNENIKLLDLSNYHHLKYRNTLANYIFLNSKSLVESHAMDFVLHGVSNFIKRIPLAIFGELCTYDRDEIESFRTFRKMVMEYLSRSNEKKPLSYAVFGPPGSGKSFGIKKILESLKIKTQILEKNISQFESYKDLIHVFQEARDINLGGKLPIIFFDEFDSNYNSNRFGWLKYFLAPMQDSLFKDGESMHPIGKAIFIFAGGTSKTFEEFSFPLTSSDEDPTYVKDKSDYKSAKVSDFISRLKGFIDIKGIDCKELSTDLLYPLRRALVLRGLLLKVPNILDSNNNISIDSNLLGALLKIPKFEHGSRSLEAIISMSDLQNAKTFQKTNLPSNQLLNMLLNTDEFMKSMNDKILKPETIEKLAKAIHEDWLEKEKAKGSQKETVKEWAALDEPTRNSNRDQALDIVRKLELLKYKIIDFQPGNSLTEFNQNDLNKMAKMEHERWMSEKIANGWIYGKPRKDSAKIHNDLVAWVKLNKNTKEYDRNAIRLIPQLLKSVGLGIVKN